MTNNFVFVLILLSFSVRLWAQNPEYSRVRIYLDGRSIADLAALGIECDHGNYSPKWFLENDLSSYDLGLLDAHGFRYEVLIEDVVAYYREQNAVRVVSSPTDVTCSGIGNRPYATPEHFVLGSMGGFPTYQEMLNQLDSMRLLYPNLISARQIISPTNLTHEGRPIYWLRISDNPDADEQQEPQILYTALHHAREPLSLAQLLYYMWYLLENYQTDPMVRHIVDNTAMYFVPCLNPDGYIYNQTIQPSGGGLWRKNRRDNGNGTFGVDLNRNYGYAWGINNLGSSPDPASDTYRGPSAFSEPETQNLRDFCIGKQFKLSVNYHSHGNMLIYPWAFSNQNTGDSTVYRQLAALFTRENRYITGTGTETVGYTSNGDADDWLYGEQNAKNKIFSMTCETGPSAYGFWPPPSQIENLCKLNLGQNLTMAWSLLNCGLVTDRTPAVIGQAQTFVRFSIKRYGFQGGDLSVRVEPVSSHVSVQGPTKVFSLQQFEEVQDSIAIHIDTSIGNGALLRYCLVLDNGFFQVRDTLTKAFGAYSAVLEDRGDSLAYWTNLGTNSFWGVTPDEYHSPPSSITDSRWGDYSNNQTSEIILNRTIDLRNCSDAGLSFWAKWDLERNYDYVQILAADDNGVFQPLCGRYTRDGSVHQAHNQPLYDGEQNFWVQEIMSLNDFLGNAQVVIKIRLVADQAVRRDGFYFDDFIVHRLEGPISSGVFLEPSAPLLNLGQSQPNPAGERVYIPFLMSESFALREDVRLNVYNALGQLQESRPIDPYMPGLHVEVDDWHEGVYFYRLEALDFRSPVFKMVIRR